MHVVCIVLIFLRFNFPIILSEATLYAYFAEELHHTSPFKKDNASTLFAENVGVDPNTLLYNRFSRPSCRPLQFILQSREHWNRTRPGINRAQCLADIRYHHQALLSIKSSLTFHYRVQLSIKRCLH